MFYAKNVYYKIEICTFLLHKRGRSTRIGNAIFCQNEESIRRKKSHFLLTGIGNILCSNVSAKLNILLYNEQIYIFGFYCVIQFLLLRLKTLVTRVIIKSCV